jgi:hypothetical protein
MEEAVINEIYGGLLEISTQVAETIEALKTVTSGEM